MGGVRRSSPPGFPDTALCADGEWRVPFLRADAPSGHPPDARRPPGKQARLGARVGIRLP